LALPPAAGGCVTGGPASVPAVPLGADAVPPLELEPPPAPATGAALLPAAAVGALPPVPIKLPTSLLVSSEEEQAWPASSTDAARAVAETMIDTRSISSNSCARRGFAARPLFPEKFRELSHALASMSLGIAPSRLNVELSCTVAANGSRPITVLRSRSSSRSRARALARRQTVVLAAAAHFCLIYR
jgi:hypothetical protein